MISYPLSLPSAPGFSDVQWTPMSAVADQESPFTYHRKTYVWDGQRRMVTATCPSMTLINAKIWQAWMYSLNGIEGTFYLTDTVGKNLRGAASGTGRVNGASQLGQDLVTDGWGAGVTGLFLKGDWISIADRLYTILTDVNSNGSGQATLTLWPKVRPSPADNAIISYGSAARGIFCLTDWSTMGWGVSRLMEGFKITAKEVVP